MKCQGAKGQKLGCKDETNKLSENSTKFRIENIETFHSRVPPAMALCQNVDAHRPDWLTRINDILLTSLQHNGKL